jgi:S1-C subfamily serine protease
LREGGGVVLNTVVPNSPAAKAGLNRGDVILKVGGQPVREHDDLFLHLGAALAGRQTELLVQPWNGHEPRAVSVVLAKLPISGAARLEGVTVQPDGRPVFAKYPVTDFGKATNRPAPVHGLRVDYTSVIAPQQLGEPIPEGVVVREVVPGSPAKAKGLQEYVDVITQVNGKPVKTPAEFYTEARQAADAGEALHLTLRNPPRTVTLP